MKIVWAAKVVFGLPAVALLLGCSHSGGSASPRPSLGNDDTIPSHTAPCVVADRESDLWPDARDRTSVRMAEVRRLIARYRAAHGSFPAVLDEVFPTTRSEWVMDYEHDAWGGALLYRRRDDDYELRSSGPDRQFGTADDIVVTSKMGTRWG
jgi:hypothetical protein